MTISIVQACIITVLCMLNVTVSSWSAFPFFWLKAILKNDQDTETGSVFCRAARDAFQGYCTSSNSTNVLETSRVVARCLFGQLERSEYENHFEKHFWDSENENTVIPEHFLALLDHMCDEHRSNHFDNVLVWLNGDTDLTNKVKDLMEITESVSSEARRIEQIASSLADVQNNFSKAANGLKTIKLSYQKAKASSFQHLIDTDRLHDELWIILQDIVATFSGQITMISYTRDSMKKDLSNVKRIKQGINNMKLGYTSLKAVEGLLNETLSEVTAHKGLRSQLLSFSLPHEDATGSRGSSTHHKSSEANGYSKNQNSFGLPTPAFLKSSLLNSSDIAGVLDEGLRFLSKSYSQLALQKFAFDAFLSPAIPMWVFLGLIATLRASGVLYFLWKAVIDGVRFCSFAAYNSIRLTLFPSRVFLEGQSKYHVEKLKEDMQHCIRDLLVEMESERALDSDMHETLTNQEIKSALLKIQSLENQITMLSEGLLTLHEMSRRPITARNIHRGHHVVGGPV